MIEPLENMTEHDIDAQDGWKPVLEDDFMDDEEGTVFEAVEVDEPDE
jgi:hypothetical protein